MALGAPARRPSPRRPPRRPTQQSAQPQKAPPPSPPSPPEPPLALSLLLAPRRPPPLRDQLERRCRHNGEDFPGLPAQLPPDLLVHPLQGAPRKSRRAHIQVLPRQSRESISFQFGGKCGLWTSRGKSSAHRTPCCR